MKTLVGTPDPPEEPEIVYVVTELGSSSGSTGFLVSAEMLPRQTVFRPDFFIYHTTTAANTWSAQ